MNLEYLTGPLVGAVIGYFTNYLAVKMLFRPKKEVYILGHKLPFTPGAIPKGKPRLAKAIGNIVANTLLTEEDIRKQFITEENKQLVVGKVVELCNQKVGQDIRALVDTEEEYLGLKEKISEFLNEKIMHAIQRMDIEAIFSKESGRILKEVIHIYKGVKKSYIYIDKISTITVILLTISASIGILIYKNIAILIIIMYLWGITLKEKRCMKNKIKILELMY